MTVYGMSGDVEMTGKEINRRIDDIERCIKKLKELSKPFDGRIGVDFESAELFIKSARLEYVD